MDPNTVWTIIALHLASTGALLVVIGMRTPHDSGLRAFGFASVLTALAYASRLATGMQLGATAVNLLSDLLLMTSTLIMLSGVRQYVGHTALVWTTYAQVLVLFVLARTLALEVSATTGRHAALNASIALGYSATAWTAARAALRWQRENAHTFTSSLWAFATLTACLSLAGFGRSAQALLMPAETLFKGPLAYAFYGVMVVGVMMVCPALIWMAFERLNAQLARMAERDPLTGLLNRKGLADAVQRYFGTRSAAPVAVLMLDIDRFKGINDVHGHLAGDDVLREVSQRIQAQLRTGDFVARVGGEEFLVVCPGLDVTAAGQLAERVRASVSASPVQLSHPTVAPSLSVTTSLGFTTGAAHALAFEQAWRLADAALYQAKSAGRDRVVASQSELAPEGGLGPGMAWQTAGSTL